MRFSFSNSPTIVLGVFGAGVIALSAAGGPLDQKFGALGLIGCMFATGLLAYLGFRVAPHVPRSHALFIIIGAAVLARLFAMTQYPVMSTDVYRYVWDGRVQGAGINPYLYVPADPALSALRDSAIYPAINRADYAHTAYPPFAQMFFFLATRFGDSLLSIRLALLACEGVTVLALLQLLKRFGRPRQLIVGYAWHPLAIWEIANAGHIDALAMAVGVVALLALVSGRYITGAAIIACGVLVKPYMAIMLPTFWRPWDWKAPVMAVALVVALYVPYLGAGSAVIGFLPGYFQEEGLSNGGGFWLVAVYRALFGNAPDATAIYFALGLALFAFLCLRVVQRPRVYDPELQCRDAMSFVILGIFFLSPNYAWYYLVLVPFVVLEGGAVIWVMTIGAIFLHVSWPDAGDRDVRFLIWKSVMNVGSLAALGWVFFIRRNASHEHNDRFTKVPQQLEDGMSEPASGGQPR